jgi:ribosomal protein S12 methylthiotransferase accessory factor YcaO
MKKQRETTPIKTLRDAYKVRGFRVLAKLDSYDLEPPVLVVALNRRAKKRCAAAAGKFAEASMAHAGGGRATYAQQAHRA